LKDVKFILVYTNRIINNNKNQTTSFLHKFPAMKIFATALLAFAVKASQEIIVNSNESELSSTELLSTSVAAELDSLVEHLDEPSRGSRRLRSEKAVNGL